MPRAWKLALRAMHTAAMGKLQLIIRSAERPIARKVSPGLNRASSRSGANWNTSSPVTISAKAPPQVIFRVWVIRLGFRAP